MNEKMMKEKEIEIPVGMLNHARAAVGEWFGFARFPPEERESIARHVLESGLKWLSENPLTPDVEQCRAIQKVMVERLPQHRIDAWDDYRLVAIEWQRRMFLPKTPPFDPTLGGRLSGRTFTQAEADAVKDYIQMCVKPLEEKK